jgi:hypothetical protein
LNDGVEERRLESPTVALLDRTSPRSSSNFNPSRMGELLKPNCSLQCRFGRQDRTLAELATGDRVGKLLDNDRGQSPGLRERCSSSTRRAEAPSRGNVIHHQTSYVLCARAGVPGAAQDRPGPRRSCAGSRARPAGTRTERSLSPRCARPARGRGLKTGRTPTMRTCLIE